jgi:hypothetical protein
MYTGTKPILAKRIFWDVDFHQLDYATNASFIIERVFEWGDVQDIRNCRRFYGDEKISNVLLKAKSLPLQTAYLAAAVINRPLTDFTCYKKIQSNLQHSHY